MKILALTLYSGNYSNGYSFFFPAAGHRYSGGGKLDGSGSGGYGWTSSPNGSDAWSLGFRSGDACVYSYDRGFGFPVRCVQASAAVFAFIKKDIEDAFVFFPASGCRGYSDSKLYNSGTYGYGWTSTLTGSNSWCLNFWSANAFMYSATRGYGFPVRCVQASAVVFAFTNDTFCFFPASGWRRDSDGALRDLGVWGFSWSSLPSDGRAWSLEFYSGIAHVAALARNGGWPVRCVQASAAVFAFIKKDIEDTFVFFPASGLRESTGGKLSFSGIWGYGWSSTPGTSSRAWTLEFYSGTATVYGDWIDCGFPVRCVQASAAVWAARKKDIKQIRFRRESGKVRLYRRGQADSVTRLGRKLSASENYFVCAAPSYSIPLIKLPVFNCLYFYKHSSGYFLFFPASGCRTFSDGKLGGAGAWGYTWTSTPNGNSVAWLLSFYSAKAYVGSDNLCYGFPVRCVQASAIVFAFTNDTFCFFPATGYREFSDGRYSYPGSWGLVWASTPSGGNAWSFTISSGRPYMNANNRGYGFTVRCVQASAAVFVFTNDTFCFFPASGNRESTGGKLSVSGIWGYGWSSTPSAASRAYALEFFSGLATMYGDYIDCGFPVRCVQASATVWAVRKENIEQIRFRRESGKACLCRRGQADSVTRLGRKLSASENYFVCVAPSYSISLIKLPDLKCLYFYKHSSGYFLFFPATGFRFLDAKLYNVGTEGHGWTSTLNGSNAWHYGGSSGNVALAVHSHEFGFPVRCVQASAVVFVKKDFKEALVFFPASGWRHESDGSLRELGSSGYARSSTPAGGSDAWELIFYSGNACVFTYPWSRGFPVRCVQASAAVFVFTNDTFCFFPASGHRGYNDGKLYESGAYGGGWSSTADGSMAWNLSFRVGFSCVDGNVRTFGRTVRCVQASATVFAFIKKNIEDTLFFFPASGFRNASGGNLGDSGRWGYGWTSTPNGGNAWYFDFYTGPAHMSNGTRGYGFPVRCVQASATVWAVRKENIEQIRFRRESGKGILCRRGRADSVIRLGCKLFANENRFVCAALSYSISLMKLPVFNCLYFYKYSSGYFFFFPASGDRDHGDGKLYNSGLWGYGWTSTPNGSNVWYLVFWSTNAHMNNNNRGYGFPVRCVQASATVWAVRKENIKQIRFRRESGKGILYRRGQADSVTHLERKLSASEAYFVCAAPSYLIMFIKLPVFKRLYFYKHSSGYFFFFPASGNRSYSSGTLGNSGVSGYGWTSVPNGSNAWYLDVFPSNARVLDNVSGGFGFPVRCVQASAPVFVYVKKDTEETFVFFPASGYRHYSEGHLRESGAWGYGWSSTPVSGSNAWDLRFYSRGASVYNDNRTYGFPVRCVQASAPVFVFIKKDFKYISAFFPASGYRFVGDGKLVDSGITVLRWSSTPYNGGSAWDLNSRSAAACMYYDSRGHGFPVRCVQASAIVFAFTNDTLFFFPASGYRHSDGNPGGSGSDGRAWTSTSSGASAFDFGGWYSEIHLFVHSRDYGFPVRCVQASAAVWAVRKKDAKQIRFRRESGKGILYRRGQADSVTRLGRKLFANENCFVCAVPSYSISLIKLPDLKHLYFYKYSSGYFFFFPAPGYREAGDGKLYNSGGRGDGWSSTPNGDRAMGLLFDSGNVRVYDGHWRGSGFPVRCVQASATVFVFIRKDIEDTFFFFPASGYRLNNDGDLRNSGTYGYGWTSTPDGGGGSYLYFSVGGTYISHYDRDSGRSVRCVQASATVFAFSNYLKRRKKAA